ncbi:hypothetical protein LQZ18_03255 [Lachnospiraceae bacterium ZAX-1]
MEFKKNIKNRYWVFCLITVFICFFLGYILLASLDKIVYPTIEELYNSIYTVYTEFGMLIFPVLVIQNFSNDYKNKNILFYKLMGYSPMKYFLNKAIVSFCFLSGATLCGILIVNLVYMNFSNFLIIVLYFEYVLLYQVLLFCLWGFLFKSVILGYVVNFSYWLISIIISTLSNNLSFFARYDAANKVYLDFAEYLRTYNSNYLYIWGNLLYSLAMTILVMAIVFVFRKRWDKNGI